MELATAVGSHFMDLLTNSEKHPLLIIGKDRWSYSAVANELGVIQPRACRILSHVAKELRVKNIRDFYKQTSPYQLAGTHGCGVTTVYVALRCFEAAGLDVDSWYSRGQKEAIVTFMSLKKRELDAAERTSKAERKRRRNVSKTQMSTAMRTGKPILTN